MAAIGPSYIGDHKAGDTIQLSFTTQVADVPTALTAGSTVIYKNASTTGSAAGVTLTASFASITGLNHIAITTASDSTFFAVGNDYTVVIGAGSTGAVNVAGTVVGSFSLRNRAADLRYVNGGSTGSTASKLELANLTIAATGSGDNAVDITAAHGNGIVVDITNDVSFGGAAAKFIARDSAKFTCGVLIESEGADGMEVVADKGPNAGLHFIGGNPSGTGAPGGPGLWCDGPTASNGAGELAGMGCLMTGGWSSNTYPDGPGLQISPGGTVGSVTGSAPAVKFSVIPDSYFQGTGTGTGAAMMLSTGSGEAIDASVEGSVGIIDSLKLANAANAGKISGGATATETIRDVNDTVDRITATVDASGNRTSITLNLS